MGYNRYNQDWDDFGRNIEDIIDRAVNSRDFQRLNQTITQAVSKAVDVGSDAVRRARDQSAREQAHRDSWKTEKRDGKVVYTYVPPKQQRPAPVQQDTRPRPRQQAPQSNLPMLYESPSGKTAGGIAKTIGGSLITGVFGLSVLTLSVVSAVESSILAVPLAICGSFLAGGVALLSSGIGNLSRMSRYKVYLKTLGEKTYCDLERLARSVGKNKKFVQKDLQKMINDGLFLEGHLDDEGKNLITSNETFKHYEESRKQLEEQKRREIVEARMQPAVSKEVTPAVQEVLDRGNAFVKKIRECNDAIPGEEISRKIYRMEMIVQKIFERAEEHPEIVPDLKKMMDYYLPMTVKLLNAYAEMDRQPVQGDTIVASKREIEDTLDTLNYAFEKLLDSVFKDTALDVSSDISVLQTLLAQEGLTEDGLDQIKKENSI